MDSVIARLCTSNIANAPNLDITTATKKITIGRMPGCDIVLNDNRCSGNHCNITILEDTEIGGHVFTLTDTSTNGTYVDDQILGRGKTHILQNGEQIEIIPNSKTSASECIGFSFSIITQSIKRSSDQFAIPEQPMIKSIQIDPEFADLACGICGDLIHQCVTALPCQHNFWGGCFSNWMQSNNTCPICKNPVSEVRRNEQIANMIESSKQTNPDLERKESNQDALEEANIISRDFLRLRSFDDQRRGCRQCFKLISGFQCVQDQQHIVCSKWGQQMPERDLPTQRWQVCRKVFCNLYWGSDVIWNQGILPMNQYMGTIFNTVPNDAITENQFEQNILIDYITFNDLDSKQIATDFLENLSQNSANISVTSSSYVWELCALDVWKKILNEYRLAIPVPEHVSNRPNCKLGRNCRLQRRNTAHAQKFNHLCESQI